MNRERGVRHSLCSLFELGTRRFGLFFLLLADIVEEALPSALGRLPIVADVIGPLGIDDKNARQGRVALTGQFCGMVQGVLRSIRTVYRDYDVAVVHAGLFHFQQYDDSHNNDRDDDCAYIFRAVILE